MSGLWGIILLQISVLVSVSAARITFPRVCENHTVSSVMYLLVSGAHADM